ncbi:MAG TPA: TolC family outer membrane protein [Xanthobacteraceae bacterium]|jgi:outer membrane protein|nr:MAG: channel protein TolC [Rhizobiales bacterium 39-66-18]HQS09234.1 TolC family outer membrane protein [Xanthobacteraceae bacterium]HQS49111.1 TolC family outer membrane protein [Xanthobacteraceae bacterium]
MSLATHVRRRIIVLAAACALSATAWSASASAQTLEAALAAAYINNPTLNSQRAGTRAIDENVPQALSGYRPNISAGVSAGSEYARSKSAGLSTTGTLVPRSANLTVTQTIFNGFLTANTTRNAESQVKGQRELLRNTEQSVLLNGVTAFMDVIQGIALLELQQQNLAALNQELRATRDRFNVGEVTRTDVAQAEARVASAQYQVAQAIANLSSYRAVYHQVIGVEPGKLVPPTTAVERRLPAKLDGVIGAGLTRNPAILASQFAVDAANFRVRMAEGGLAPNLNVQGQVLQSYDQSQSVDSAFGAAVTLNLSVPIYQGGAEYSAIRQAKEYLSQARIEVDVNRDAVRTQGVQYWGALEAAKAQIEAAQSQVAANTLALEGVREEWRVGQRTTTDVLNAQTDLTNSKSALVIAQRDRVVAAYSLVSVIGKLDAVSMGLKVPVYDPKVHYQQVRDSWFGLRTPDGK